MGEYESKNNRSNDIPNIFIDKENENYIKNN